MTVETQKFIRDIDHTLEYPLLHIGHSEITLAGIFIFTLIIVLSFLGEMLFRRLFIKRVLQHTHLQPSMQYAIGKIAGYLFIAIGFYMAFKLVGFDFSSLAFVAGAIGVGLGFGLQNIISNFVSGIIILAERPISVGDRIEMGGVLGVVTRINLRSTNVVTYDNIAIIVPNSDFITTKVTNWSYGDPKVRLRLPIGVAYGTDLALLRKLLTDMAKEHSNVLKEPPPDLFFIEFGNSSLNFELAVWMENTVGQPRNFRSELYYAMDKVLRENKIEVPFPQRDLHLRSGAFVLQPPTPPPAENSQEQK